MSAEEKVGQGPVRPLPGELHQAVLRPGGIHDLIWRDPGVRRWCRNQGKRP
jgi:hypothetical protein